MRTRYLLVYRYEYWDESRSALGFSSEYATVDAILKAGALPLLSSGKLAPPSPLAHEVVGVKTTRADATEAREPA